MSFGWESGQRVPVTMPGDDDEDRRPEREAGASIRRVIGFLLADPNPALGVECMALVTSLCYQGDAMAEIARRHNVTRAAVSKRCVELCEAFGLPPSRAMRPSKNRERCRKARLRTIAES